MILITGHKGFIGSKLMKLIGNSLSPLKFKGGVTGIDLQEGINVLTYPFLLERDVDVIFHLAAQTSVVSSWFDPVHDMDNIRITARLVDKFPSARIIYANSAAAKEPIMSPYGFSKWASAEYLKRFHKDYVICQFPNVYGGDSKSVVDIFKGRDSVTIFGDGLQTRDYVHVDDIVLGLVKAVEWPIGEYEMGSGIATTVLELAKGKGIIFSPARKEARESVLRNTTPDWRPNIQVKDYLHD